MNTPNKLTVARMIIVPFLVVFLLTGWGGDANRYISLALFVVALPTGLTDIWHAKIILLQILVNLWTHSLTNFLFALR